MHSIGYERCLAQGFNEIIVLKYTLCAEFNNDPVCLFEDWERNMKSMGGKVQERGPR